MSTTTPLAGLKVQIGPIEVGKKLGNGGFGTVHAATMEGSEFPFAIKFLDPSPFNENLEAAKSRFLEEGKLLFQLRHPYIVGVFGVGEHEKRPFILMERFAGYDLNRVREHFSIDDPMDVLPFIRFVAHALGHAHSHGIVHRDVKPSNLMTVKGDARVLDFGIAAVLDPEGTRFTRTGETCVGDSYTAPELAENPLLLDPRSDIYSLGACWFWLLTGRVPKGANFEAALRGAIDVPPEYERVLLRCLDQIDSRYTATDELIGDIRELEGGRNPRLRDDEIRDDDALALGTIARDCPLPDSTTSFYSFEQGLNGALDRLAMGIALRRLRRLEMIKVGIEGGEWEKPFEVLSIEEKGARWIEENQARVEEVFEGRVNKGQTGGTPSEDDVDVPF